MRVKDDNKRIAIMEASIELINEIGFSETSMSKIAKKAKVASATIYTYFENKEDLLNNLYIMTNEKMSQKVFSDLGSDSDIKETFSGILKNIFFYFKKNSRDFLFLEQFCSSPLINKISQEEVEKYYIPIGELLEKGKREGIFKDYPTPLLEGCVLSQIFYLAKTHIHNKKISDSDISRVITIAWDGIIIHE